MLAQRQRQQAASRPKKIKAKQVLKKVELPSTLRLDNLVNLLHERLCASFSPSLPYRLYELMLTAVARAVAVQRAAERIGLEDVRPDRRQFHLRHSRCDRKTLTYRNAHSLDFGRRIAARS